jgi:hypothetical protein
MDAVAAGIEIPEIRSWQEVNNVNLTPEENRAFHLARLATLIGWAAENPEPEPEPDPSRRVRLVLLFNAAGLQRAWLFDGYHRLATAYLMERPHVDLYINSSDDDRLLEALPGALVLEEHENGSVDLADLTPAEHAQAEVGAYFIALTRGDGQVPPYDRELAVADFLQAAGAIIALRAM